MNSLLSIEKPNIHIVPQVDRSHTIRPAFEVSSPSSYASIASPSIFDDSICSYIEAPPLQSTSEVWPHFLIKSCIKTTQHYFNLSIGLCSRGKVLSIYISV